MKCALPIRSRPIGPEPSGAVCPDWQLCVRPQCEVLPGLARPDSDHWTKGADLLVTPLGVEPFRESVNVNVCRIDARLGKRRQHAPYDLCRHLRTVTSLEKDRGRVVRRLRNEPRAPENRRELEPD